MQKDLLFHERTFPSPVVWVSPHLEWLYVRDGMESSLLSKKVSYELLKPLAICKDKNQLVHQADIVLADASTLLHLSFQELGVKSWKKTNLGVRNFAFIGKGRHINTCCELLNIKMLHICSKHALDFHFSAFRKAYQSHRPSHKWAARPTCTSTFHHGWLPMAPHKLPIINNYLHSVHSSPSNTYLSTSATISC